MIGGRHVAQTESLNKFAEAVLENEGKGGELVSSPSYLKLRLSELVIEASKLRNVWPPFKRNRPAIFNIQMQIDSTRHALGYPDLIDCRVGANAPLVKE